MNNPITTLSREDLQKEVKAIRDSGADLISPKMGLYLEAMESLLAVMDARIDAYRVRHHHEPQGTGTKIDVQDRPYYEARGDYHYTPLYAAPPAPIVPSGWKLVPVEPTEEMIEAGDQFMDGLSRLGEAYEAMIAAAPAPGDS